MLASDAGGNYTQVYNGFLLNVSARHAKRSDVPGRLRHRNDARPTTAAFERSAGIHRARCAGPDQPVVHTRPRAWVTRYTGLGSYTIPKVDVLFSRHVPKRQGARRWPRTWSSRRHETTPRPRLRQQRAERDRQPGRARHAIRRSGERDRPAGGRRSSGSGGRRTNVGFDIYNVTNSNPVLTYNQGVQPDDQHDQPVGELAGPAVHAAAALREVQRADRFPDLVGTRGSRDSDSNPGSRIGSPRRPVLSDRPCSSTSSTPQ